MDPDTREALALAAAAVPALLVLRSCTRVASELALLAFYAGVATAIVAAFAHTAAVPLARTALRWAYQAAALARPYLAEEGGGG